MIQFGHSCSPHKAVTDEIELIAGMGFDFAEITMDGEGNLKALWKQRANIKNALKRHNIFATAHAPLAVDVGNFLEPVQRLWVDQSIKIIQIADKIGIKKINFHANYSSLIIPSRELKELILRNHVKSLKTLTAVASKYNIQLLLENTHETLKDFHYITSGVKKLYVNIDVGHAFIGGGNAMIKKYIRTISNISHVHVHDNNGKRDEHLAVGHGRINFTVIGAELKKIGFDGTVTLEVFEKNRALAKTSLAKIKRLWLL